MPRGDRTGPDGCGPMTGRAAGYCGGYGAPGYMNTVLGGRGLGFGHGRGFFHRGYASRQRWLGRSGRRWPDNTHFESQYYPEEMSRNEELESLKDQVKYMEEGVKTAEERIAELEKQNGDENSRKRER